MGELDKGYKYRGDKRFPKFKQVAKKFAGPDLGSRGPLIFDTFLFSIRFSIFELWIWHFLR